MLKKLVGPVDFFPPKTTQQKKKKKKQSGRYVAQYTLLVLTARASHSCTYSIPQIGPSLFITCCFQQSFTLSLPRHANVKQATVM